MTTVTPAALSAASARRATARLTTDSRSPLGPTAPVSSPPWPGSSTTFGVATGVARLTSAELLQGVCTTQPPGWRPNTGSTTPPGVCTTAAGGGSGSVVGGAVGGGGGGAGAVVGGVVGGAPAARRRGSRAWP